MKDFSEAKKGTIFLDLCKWRGKSKRMNHRRRKRGSSSMRAEQRAQRREKTAKRPSVRSAEGQRERGLMSGSAPAGFKALAALFSSPLAPSLSLFEASLFHQIPLRFHSELLLFAAWIMLFFCKEPVQAYFVPEKCQGLCCRCFVSQFYQSGTSKGVFILDFCITCVRGFFLSMLLWKVPLVRVRLPSDLRAAELWLLFKFKQVHFAKINCFCFNICEQVRLSDEQK